MGKASYQAHDCHKEIKRPNIASFFAAKPGLLSRIELSVFLLLLQADKPFACSTRSVKIDLFV